MATRRRRSWLRDYAGPSTEEVRAARDAERATQDGSTLGGVIGTGLGAVAGGALGMLGGPAGALTGAGLGAGIGGGAGQAIGGYLGSKKADAAGDVVRKHQLEREQELTEEQLRREAVERFLATS